MTKYILGIDAGTTSARTLILDQDCNILSIAQKEITQHYPSPGWVEHDPNELISTQLETMRAALRDANLHPKDLFAVSLTNQRETAMIWDKKTGEPIHNAIVWSSRQTQPIIERWEEAGLSEKVRQKTGLILDAYYSASKIRWILEHVPGAIERAEAGELMAGTVDTWLIWHLTGKKKFVTDYTNAARTMMFNVNTLEWDQELLDAYGIPKQLLSEVLPCDSQFGTIEESFGYSVPIASNLGDQQAGLFGQACFNEGMAKMTYGTSGVFCMNAGQAPMLVGGVTTSACWSYQGKTNHDIEGVVYSMGKTMQWLRDDLKIIQHAADSEWYGGQVSTTHGVYLVPAFTGFAAPHWDPYARACIVGMSNATNRLHIIRAAVESMVYQTRDLVDAVTASGELKVPSLRVDGGAVGNNMLCQLQSDILGIPVIRPAVAEATALGAAFMAGLTTGLYSGFDDLSKLWKSDRVFEPNMSEDERNTRYYGWAEACKLASGWNKRVSDQ